MGDESKRADDGVEVTLRKYKCLQSHPVQQHAGSSSCLS